MEAIREALPDYARDLKLNIGSVLTMQGAPGLTERQIASVALATAIAARNTQLTRAIETWAEPFLDAAHVNASRAAAAIMGMNNIYYRFLHLVEDGEYQTMPARLRMNVIGNPGVDKADFELWSLAVSAINGCGKCINAHEKVLLQAGVTEDAIQAAVRFASIIQSVAVALEAADATAAFSQAAE
jgi:alkyl hydroperoxide reductase subunit D